jgi:L-lysine 6-transaminase
MVRATRFLQIIEEEKFVDNAGKMGSLLIEEIQKLASLYPEKITNVRGLGLLVAFDLPTKEEREEFVKRCFDKRLLLMIAEPKTIRLRPFLDIRKEDINKMVSIFNNLLNDMR